MKVELSQVQLNQIAEATEPLMNRSRFDFTTIVKDGEAFSIMAGQQAIEIGPGWEIRFVPKGGHYPNRRKTLSATRFVATPPSGGPAVTVAYEMLICRRYSARTDYDLRDRHRGTSPTALLGRR